MAYSQSHLTKAFTEGFVPGEQGIPKRIETVISNVFLFPERVYKFYKNDNDFFNSHFRDLSSKETRFAFTRADFLWNNTLSPSIYLELRGAILTDGEIAFTAPDDTADELVIVMLRVNTENVLFEKLLRNEVSRDDAYEIGKQLAQSLENVQQPLAQRHNFHQLFKARLDDLRSWIGSVPADIPSEEVERYMAYLERFWLENQGLFEGELSREVTADGDFHSHNALLSGERFLLMDTYPPKDEWGLGHKHIAPFRLGADIFGLTNSEDAFNRFIEGYEEASGSVINPVVRDPFLIYATAIALPYLYMLQNSDSSKRAVALKLHQFMRDQFRRITEINPTS